MSRRTAEFAPVVGNRMTDRRRGGRGGFTLLEALLASSLLAIGTIAIIVPFATGARNELVESRRILALNLAKEMTEEVLSRPFLDPDGYSEPGPEISETSRDLFDNVDDYHGYVEPPGTITNLEGVIIDGPAAQDLSRHVSAQYIYLSGQDVSDEPTFIRLIVTVRHKNNDIVTLTRLVYANE